ncbi:hypothetical protein HMPREF9237_00717 [Actinotignum schaalii FB123-CNA-2]|uniref:Uncharacterized protein n=1 Tax=Actinotignum schaalii FB123-CNA-2 TaxID=883067 RepID=S2VH88_9ACTO|nr:hypothetical protein HMPREF9237_00717 [Actinotignum schaalii FB123-CNA-2]
MLGSLGFGGITPARAGKSEQAWWKETKARNYPRSRGEEQSSERKEKMARELPPLARGRDAAQVSICAVFGITPARAGKRISALGSCSISWNYPRSRGEELISPLARGSRLELPPLARGRAISLRMPEKLPGITPARAGKRLCHDERIRAKGNYPRSRGEEIA